MMLLKGLAPVTLTLSIFSVEAEEFSGAGVFPISFIAAVVLLLTEGPQACNCISLLSTLSSGPRVLVHPVYN